MRKQNLHRDETGISAIEMAILLPLLILLVMAVIEFGLYFVKYQIATRAVATISDTIQKNPAGATHDLAAQGGLSFLDLTSAPNFICAKSYADNPAANAGLCNTGEWQTGTPTGVVAGAPYFVAVRASSPHLSITPFTALSNSFPPPIDVKAVVMVNGGGAIPSGAVMAFNLAACPSGWRDMPSLYGRTIVGSGAYSETSPGSKPEAFSTTYSLGSTGGSARISLGLSELPRHFHPIRLGSFDQGDADGTWQPGDRNNGALEFDWASSMLRGGSGGVLVANGDNLGPFATATYVGGGPDAGAGEAQPFDKRTPYIALKYCVKN